MEAVVDNLRPTLDSRIFEMLSLIHRRGRLYQAQLEREGWNRVTMTKVLRKLVEQGLATPEVEFCGRNGTRVWYSLTPKGRNVAELVVKVDELLEDR